jgi:hypothetical protein
MDRINIIFTALVTLATLVQALFAYRIYKLEKTIEDARNTCIIFCRVKVSAESKVTLSISNLSAFDVWVQDIVLFVTNRTVISNLHGSSPVERNHLADAQQTIGGDFHLSHGETREDIEILSFLNPEGTRAAEYAEANFHVEVNVWANGSEVSEKTPKYNLTWGARQQSALTRRS